MADTSAQQSLGSESQGQQAGRGFESGQQPAPHATALQDYMNSAVDQTGKILKTMGQRVRSFADSVREEPGTQHHFRATAERVARKLESSGGAPASVPTGTILPGTGYLGPQRSLFFYRSWRLRVFYDLNSKRVRFHLFPG